MRPSTRVLMTASLFLLIATLFSGCATGPKAVKKSTSSPPATEMQVAMELLDAAQSASKSGNHENAVALYEQIQQSGQSLPVEHRYDFGLSLSRIGRFQEAIEQLRTHVEQLNRRSPHFISALEEISRAEEKLQQQLAETEKQRHMAIASSRNAGILEQNWTFVQQQVAAGASSFIEPLTGIEMVRITGGCYQMGDLFDVGKNDEQPVHQVCVDDFYLGKYEVTQAQWQQVMGYNPSQSQNGSDFPVENLSWLEAIEFTDRLNGPSGRYRLPSEAEWEFAARSGGKKEKFSGSNSIDAVAWHEDNSGDKIHRPGQKAANGLGLYDMSGNLYEWVLDRYAADYYQHSPRQNPLGPETGKSRVYRGGSWESEIGYSRTSYRSDGLEASYRDNDTGLRLALPVAPSVIDSSSN